MRQVTAGVALVLLIFSAGLAGDWEVFLNSNDVTTIWLDRRDRCCGALPGAWSPTIRTAGTFHKTAKSVGGLRSNTVTAVASDCRWPGLDRDGGQTACAWRTAGPGSFTTPGTSTC